MCDTHVYIEQTPSAPPAYEDDDDISHIPVKVSSNVVSMPKEKSVKEIYEEKQQSVKEIYEEKEKSTKEIYEEKETKRLKTIYNKIKNKIDNGICHKAANNGHQKIELWNCWKSIDKKMFSNDMVNYYDFKYNESSCRSHISYINYKHLWFIDDLIKILPKDVNLQFISCFTKLPLYYNIRAIW